MNACYIAMFDHILPTMIPIWREIWYKNKGDSFFRPFYLIIWIKHFHENDYLLVFKNVNFHLSLESVRHLDVSVLWFIIVKVMFFIQMLSKLSCVKDLISESFRISSVMFWYVCVDCIKLYFTLLNEYVCKRMSAY